jgi:hypothetical protein
MVLDWNTPWPLPFLPLYPRDVRRATPPVGAYPQHHEVRDNHS